MSGDLTAPAATDNRDRALDPGRAPSRPWRRFRRNRAAILSLILLLLIVHACVLSLPWSVRQFNEMAFEFNRHPPSPTAPFGYDFLGRGLLPRTLLGGAISLGIGIAAATIAVTIGVLWGSIAALAGGRLDNAMMRIVDILFGLPYILLVILFKIAFEPMMIHLLGNANLANIVLLFLAIGAVNWLTMARVIRGQVLSLRAQPFIEAARAAGLGPSRVLVRHVLPNLVGPIVVYATLTIPSAILQESFLSFLGIGIAPPVPTWGSLASEGVAAINTVVSFWWMIFFPCLFLGVTLLCLNFVGDGLRDAFDPRGGA
jgi:oligopeptide transport system permease protein